MSLFLLCLSHSQSGMTQTPFFVSKFLKSISIKKNLLSLHPKIIFYIFIFFIMNVNIRNGGVVPYNLRTVTLFFTVSTPNFRSFPSDFAGHPSDFAGLPLIFAGVHVRFHRQKANCPVCNTLLQYQRQDSTMLTNDSGNSQLRFDNRQNTVKVLTVK
jgi:hypothetical protein